MYKVFFLFVSLQVTLSQGFVRSAKENVTITTKLVSTKLTQNVDLMKLLNWKSSQNSISDTLSKIMSLSGEEIVKFLQDILDALFAMFSTGQFLSDNIFFLLNFDCEFTTRSLERKNSGSRVLNKLLDFAINII